MGYCKVVQSGTVTEIFNYEKLYVRQRQGDIGKRRVRVETRQYLHNVYSRSAKSIKRAKTHFIRLVEANISPKESPCILTLTIERETPLTVGYEYLRLFWQRLNRKINGLRYIGVPEWQERGVLHFHFLVWGFDEKSTVVRSERSTRNIQRCWQKGFLDVRFASKNTYRLAGYLSKYFTKTIEDDRLCNRRAYTCSRNIKRSRVVGTNQSDIIMEMIPPIGAIDYSAQYETLYLGVCNYKKIINK